MFPSYRRTILWAAFLLGGVLPAAEPTKIVLRDVTSNTGITFVHADGSSGKHYLIEAVASGLATFDYDLDGDMDIYFLSGSQIKGATYPVPPTNRLYRNDGGMKFTDVTEQSGLGDLGFGLGVAVGDFDNDGWPDVYVNNFGANALYHNNGDGSFSRVTGQPVIACGDKVAGGVSMLDIEGDGDLDIYVANYIKFDYDNPPPSELQGLIVYGGPTMFVAEQDDLLRNNGDGTFTNISVAAGIAEQNPNDKSPFAEWGMATIAFDFDDDGDTDIFVANDSTNNFLWENDGSGRFTEIGVGSGISSDFRGGVQGSMGVDAADANGNGRVDLYVTAYENQNATLYENEGGGFGFRDATRSYGLAGGTGHLVNWGLAFADLDNDGDQDLFLANGHIQDNQHEINPGLQYEMRNMVYENTGNRRFEDVSEACGLHVIESSRGAVLDDLDADGRLDIVILNSRSGPTILRNESDPALGWVELELVGTSCNRGGVGCQVQVTTGGQSQSLEVHSGHGYQSHFGTVLHFGVGDAKTVDRVVVKWIGGGSEEFSDIQVNNRSLLRQGLGETIDDPIKDSRAFTMESQSMDESQNDSTASGSSADASQQIIKPEYTDIAETSAEDAPPSKSMLGPFVLLALAVGALVVLGKFTGWFGLISNQRADAPVGPAAAAIQSQLDRASAEPTVEAPNKFEHLPPLHPLVPIESDGILQEGRDVAAHLVSVTDGKLDALEMQARLEFEFGDPAIAKEIWTKMIAQNPNYTFALRGLGDIATLEGDLAGAVTYLRKAVLAEPDDVARQNLLAIALLANNETDEAAQVLELAIKAQPEYSLGHQELGQIKLQQQDFEGARQEFDAAIQYDPTLSESYHGLAKALMRLGETEEAKIQQAKHVELRAQYQAELQDGRETYNDLSAVAEDVGRAYTDMARVYLDTGNAQAAEMLLVRSARMNPNDANPRQAMAWISRNKGRLFDAIRWLSEVAALQPEQFAVASEIAHLYSESGQLDRAELIMTEFVTLNPENPQALEAISRFFVEAKEDYPKAIENAKKLTEVVPTAASFAWLAQVFRSSQDIPQAIIAMERTIELEPENAQYPQLLAMLRETATSSSSPSEPTPTLTVPKLSLPQSDKNED